MKIIVCVKVIKGEINPFDQSAIEYALGMSGDVTVVSMGPEACGEALLPLTRLGARVVLVSDVAFAGSDTIATSYILSKAIENLKFDLIICGRQSVDGDTAQVGPMLAKRLSLPVLTNVLDVSVADGGVNATTRLGEEFAPLPALITVERNRILRFPSIFSKLGSVEIIDNKSLCCDVEKCGLNGSPTRVLKSFENQIGKRSCKFISRDMLIPLVSELMKKAQGEQIEKCCEKKLKSVWAIGHEVSKKAGEIADEVIVIDSKNPEEIEKMAREQKPDVILWNSDLWGRKNAPLVAVGLETGLCADCTELDVENNRLVMYRPAGGGSVYAKIECLTSPVMATVRTKSNVGDIVVSGGKGVEKNFEKLKELAHSLGADLGASRGLVDTGVADYGMQVGLTGKTISPKVYIAVGISGAVQHTCAISGAGWVIAINPDKDARIFDYADFGIIDKL